MISITGVQEMPACNKRFGKIGGGSDSPDFGASFNIQ